MPSTETGGFGEGHAYRGGKSRRDQLTERIAAGAAVQAALLRKDPGSSVSAADRETLADAIDARVALTQMESRGAEGDALLERIGAGGAGGRTRQVLALSGASRQTAGAEIAEKMLNLGGGHDGKSLMPVGAVTTGIPMAPSPFEMGRIPTSLMDALPLIQHPTPIFSYIRQTTRTINAAPVLPGDVKPTSPIGAVSVNVTLEVVAHLSEKINSYWLSDNQQLAAFVSSELLYGLNRAVEDQIANGTGVPPQLNGILNTSGIQVQPAVGTDLLATTRSAVTALENVGELPGLFVFNPADWQRLELSRTVGSGQLEMVMPVDRAKMQLWGIQTVVSTALAAGTALLIDLDSIAVDTDTRGISVAWNPWSNFSTNEIVCRAEGRFAVSIPQPGGIVRIDLPAIVP